MQNYVCWIYMLYGAHVVVLQLLSSFQRFLTPWTPIWQASLSSTISQRLLKVMSIALVSLSNNLIICWPLLILPSIFPSIRVFSNDLTLHIRWPEYWSFSFSPCNEYSGLISFNMDWFDLLAVQGTLNIVRTYQFFSVQPSLQFNSHNHTWLYSFEYRPLSVKWCLCFWICCLGWS